MPTNRCAVLQLAIVAAFAVCIQSAKRPAVSKLSLSACHPVCAWLIASRKKRRFKCGSNDPYLKLLCLIHLNLFISELSFVYTTSKASENQVL